MNSEFATIVQRIGDILKNKEKEPLHVLGGYIVGATIVRDDWEEKFQARYPLLNEIAELGADLEVTDDLKRAGEIVNRYNISSHSFNCRKLVYLDVIMSCYK